MKRYSIILVISCHLLVTNLFSQQETTTDPCLDPQFHEQCVNGVKSVFDDFIYLRSRPFSRDMSGEKYVVNLKGNTLYLFDVCQGVKSKAVLTLYNAENENDPIASTFDAKTGRFNRVLSFYSKSSSGKYLISISFEKSDNDCAVVVYGMIRQNIDAYVKIP